MGPVEFLIVFPFAQLVVEQMDIVSDVVLAVQAGRLGTDIDVADVLLH
jgi:hypothetical protein